MSEWDNGSEDEEFEWDEDGPSEEPEEWGEYDDFAIDEGFEEGGYDERSYGERRVEVFSRRYNTCCGSGFPTTYCRICYGNVCEKCHPRLASRNIQIPHTFTFQAYTGFLESARHLREVGVETHELEERMAQARRRLIADYGIDPERGNADSLYNEATSPGYLKFLAENSLKPTLENALRYIAENKISIEGFTDNEVARALNHNLERVYTKYVGELRRDLRKSIITHFCYVLMTGDDDRSHLERLHGDITRAGMVFGKTERGLDSYIRDTVPVTLTNLRFDDETVKAVRTVQRLLDEAEKLHRQAKKEQSRLIKHTNRTEAARKVLEAEKILVNVEPQLREKFPEIALETYRTLYRQLRILKYDLSKYVAKVSEAERVNEEEELQLRIDTFYGGGE